MRNPYKTCRKRSTKKPSRNQRARLNDKMARATVALEQWFTAYMAELRDNSTHLNGVDSYRPF